MRIVKLPDGSFFIEEEPMRLTGEAAEKFLRDMEARNEAPHDASREAFLADCDRAYLTVS